MVYRILIVDDEIIERTAMEELVNWQSIGAVLAGSARNGKEALHKIDELTPDIVITDIKMPVMDGLELIEKARSSYPDIVFVVLSGYGEFEYTSRAMENGIKHYILKPVDSAKVLETSVKAMKDVDEIRKTREKRAHWNS